MSTRETHIDATRTRFRASYFSVAEAIKPSPGVSLATKGSALTNLQRALMTLLGLIPGVLVSVFALSGWAPTRFIVAWTATFTLLTLGFLAATLRSNQSAHIESVWSILSGVAYAALPWSALVWGEGTEPIWIAGAIAFAYIAYELLAIPFLTSKVWYVGIAIIALSIAITAGVRLHWILSPLVPVAVATMALAANRTRVLKEQLTQRLVDTENMAGLDPLTGLLNRRGLSTLFDRYARDELTVAMLDVDRFKHINDAHGYSIGDQVLQQIATELTQRLGPAWHLCRQGGDEFVAVAPGHHTLTDGAITAPVNCKISWHGRLDELQVHLSIGYTTGRGRASDRLLSEAGFALRSSKRAGDRILRFGGELRQQFARALEIAAMDRSDESTGSLVPFGQAIYDSDGHVIGCELLVRWRRPGGTLMLPDQFLPMTIENGVMAAINDEMLTNAVAFAARFNNRRSAPFVAVNISASHLSAAGLCNHVEALLEQYRVPAERLMIEITESERLERFEQWESTAWKLRSMGVKLAIDDFGSGYSSIERLHHLPISHLKFDRSLIRTVSGPFGEIVEGVARFGEATNIGIIAEGIETLDELESMRALGVSTFQGFYFSRPIELDRLETDILSGLNTASKRPLRSKRT